MEERLLVRVREGGHPESPPRFAFYVPATNLHLILSRAGRLRATPIDLIGPIQRSAITDMVVLIVQRRRSPNFQASGSTTATAAAAYYPEEGTEVSSVSQNCWFTRVETPGWHVDTEEDH